MTPPAASQLLVLHLSGPDAPGILAELSLLIARAEASVVDLHQNSVFGSLSLALVVHERVDGAAVKAVRHYAGAHALHLEVVPARRGAAEGDALACGVCVTLLGEQSGGTPLAEVTRVLLTRGLNVRQTRSLGQPLLLGVELCAIKTEGGGFPVEDLRDLRSELLALAPTLGVDVAVQRDDFYRKSKRLLCMDVDSTFVKGEFIDELAELAGVKNEVAAITAAAMRGELDFKGALRERVKLLRGLPMNRALELCDRFELSPGGHDLVRTAKRLGLRVGLVSGGFDFFVNLLRERFNLDFAFANELEVEHGVLTGNVLGTIVDSERKAQVLRDMAHVYDVRLEQTIAVGDGANDILMLQAAGLGIAYQAKPRVQAVAHSLFNHHDRLDTLFYLMGFDPPEVTSACR